MSSITIEVDGLTHLEAAGRRFLRLADQDRHGLLEGLGAVLESQTRRRIQSEKTAPDGQAWAPNKQGTSILLRSGQLLASLFYSVAGRTVTLGAPKIYAAVHQFGATIKPRNRRVLRFKAGGGIVFARQVTIPARPFLGVSKDNADEIRTVVEDWLDGLLRGGAT